MASAWRWLKSAVRRVPVVLQGEVSECGIACLTMISRFHGRHIELGDLRQRYAAARDGISLFQIIGIAQELGMVCRPLQLGPEHMKDLRLPAILFWNNMHFVVLERTGKRGISIVDPGVGRRFYTWEDALPYFSNVALEVMPGLNFSKASAERRTSPFDGREILRNQPSLWRYLAPMAFLSIVIQLVSIAAPKLFGLTIDEVVAKNDEDLLSLLMYIFGGLFLFKTLCSGIRVWLNGQMRIAVMHETGSAVVDWMLRLPLRFFERRSGADLLRRVQVIDQFHLKFTAGWIDIGIEIIFAIVFVCLMGFINLKLTVMTLILCGLFFLIKFGTIPFIENRQRAAVEAETRRNTSLLGSLSALEPMKLYGYEGIKSADWSGQQADVAHQYASVERIQEFGRVLHEGVSHAHSLLISALGAMAVLSGENTIGHLFAFVLYKDMFMHNILTTVDKYVHLRLVEVELRRLDDVVAEPPELELRNVYRADLQAERESVTQVRLDAATFRYSAFEKPIFDNVDIQINRGDKIAILGPSGCGKSTLLKVLAGFYRPDAGTMSVNGILLDNFGLRRYRQSVAYVTSHDEIIDGTVINNITFDHDQYDAMRLQACVTQAHLLDTVLTLPNGFNTLLGHGGVCLSSGQKQRLLIARALYRQPDILFFDEPTSHLDAAARDVIIETLRDLPVTCVVVTHDAVLLAACRRSYRMADGALQDMGSSDAEREALPCPA